ncbi:NAD-dependent epimerase/dehydratase family protein [Shewanella sp. SG44-6]|uniref:NAD-dependent epimerase/dehydratase family protein n=1 Tax=Shewanella sp. SG44-6 TaxID=2760959 RepID=UPI001603736B|nr:NAD-dependent epimerase/dehydratase family protein [Shewanella sp. SG44-6]MBB1391286.1 NAD-dependent epimerase/dehydratase family protein [Shewanella sp. SG44-6]
MGRILLSGSTGFIGRNLYCSNKNAFKRIIRSVNKLSTFDDYIIHDFAPEMNWSNAFDDITSIIHLAGIAHSKTNSYEDYKSVNVDSTLNFAMQAATAGVKRFVFVSSIGVNGTQTFDLPFTHNSQPHPRNYYSKSKLDAELGLQRISNETGMELVIIRPTLVYGLNAPGNFGALSRFIIKSPLLPFGLVKNRRSFISVQNLANLLLVCANHPNAGGHIFLASEGETVSIKTFTSNIANGFGKSVFQLPVPIGFMSLVGKLLGKSSMVEQLVSNLEVDSSNLREILDWTPPYTMKESMAFLKQVK